VEKDGWRPSFYVPWLFSVDYCFGIEREPAGDNRSSPEDVEGPDFRWWWGDGSASNRLYFPLVPEAMCELEYFNGFGTMRFEFE